MLVLVDADACPVKDIIEEQAIKYKYKLIYVCDTTHNLMSKNGSICIVDKGSDSSDHKIVSLIDLPCLVITQDYALALLCLLKGSHVLHPNGFIICNDNIDMLLLNRYLNSKARKLKERLPSIKKRTCSDDTKFKEALIKELKTLSIT